MRPLLGLEESMRDGQYVFVLRRYTDDLLTPVSYSWSAPRDNHGETHLASDGTPLIFNGYGTNIMRSNYLHSNCPRLSYCKPPQSPNHLRPSLRGSFSVTSCKSLSSLKFSDCSHPFSFSLVVICSPNQTQFSLRLIRPNSIFLLFCSTTTSLLTLIVTAVKLVWRTHHQRHCEIGCKRPDMDRTKLKGVLTSRSPVGVTNTMQNLKTK